MLRYILRKIAFTIPVLLIVSIAVFAMLHLGKGDPVSLYVGPNAPHSLRVLARHELGLDQPLPTQYAIFLGHAIHGDFGQSIVFRESVMSLLGQRLPATLLLGFCALVLSYVIAIPMGIMAAARANTWIDYSATGGALMAMAVPNFWLALLMALVFGVYLGWLPVSGYGTPQNLVLPTLALAAEGTGLSMRLMRSSMVDVLQQDFIRTLHAKGLQRWRVLGIHAAKNALIATISLFGLRLGMLIGGAIIIETVFDWPGIGRLLVSSVLQADYPVVQALTLILATAAIAANVLADVLYALVDPRVRYG
jgi:ABC-type dipeptide/oligopeptide/nickel transport system permease component